MSKRTGCTGLADAVSPLPGFLCDEHSGCRRSGWTGRGIGISLLPGVGGAHEKPQNQTRTGMGWVMASVLMTTALFFSCSGSASGVTVVGVSSSASMTVLPTTYARTPLSEPLPPMNGWLLVTEEQWEALQAFPIEQQELFACIARAESGFDPDAVGDSGHSEGAWQVQPRWWGPVPQDLAGQAAQAAAIWSAFGSGPWTTAGGCR